MHPNDLTTDEEIDAALEGAKAFNSFPKIVEANYRPAPGWECLMLRLSNGHRLPIPRKVQGELKNATQDQAAESSVSIIRAFPSGGPNSTTAFTFPTSSNTAGIKNHRQPSRDSTDSLTGN